MDVSVNGIPHQTISGPAPRLRAAPRTRCRMCGRRGRGPGTCSSSARATASTWRSPCQGRRRSVDAVEIDPGFATRARHSTPTSPTTTPGCTVTSTTAGPSWNAPTAPTTLIIFALPDSLTLVSGREPAAAGELPVHRGGDAGRPRAAPPRRRLRHVQLLPRTWLVDRLAATVARRFGHAPCVDLVSTAATGGDRARRRVASSATARCAGRSGRRAADRPPPPTGDDRPFLYLKDTDIPSLYLITLGLILLVSLIAVRVVAGPLPADAPLRRPVPARGGVPAAGDQERDRLRAAVRHDVGGQRDRVRRRAGRRARRGRDHPPLPHPAAAGHVRGLFGGLPLAWLVPHPWLLRPAAARRGRRRGRSVAFRRSSRRTSSSPNASRHRPTPRRPSARTCWARWWAAAWSTWRW